MHPPTQGCWSRSRSAEDNLLTVLVYFTETERRFYPYLALFSCILNGDLHHWTWVLIAFSHLQKFRQEH